MYLPFNNVKPPVARRGDISFLTKVRTRLSVFEARFFCPLRRWRKRRTLRSRLNFQLRFLSLLSTRWRKKASSSSRKKNVNSLVRENSGKRIKRRRGEGYGEKIRGGRRVISQTSVKDNRGYSFSVIRLPKRLSSCHPFKGSLTRAFVISGSREKMVGCRRPRWRASSESRPGFSRSFAIVPPESGNDRLMAASIGGWDCGKERDDWDINERHGEVHLAKEPS